jgi:glycosyltransferase involved in cell wall biosynthesis
MIALVLMVKDEAPRLPRLLDSVKGLIDCVIALDTGSSDGTLELLEKIGAHIKRSMFRDFGKSRSELMKFACGKADWLLLLDADMTVRAVVPRPREDLEKRLDPNVPAYFLQMGDGMIYWVPRLVRGDRAWKFEGATHERLVGVERENAIKLPGLVVEHHFDGSSRRTKFERDLELLLLEHEEHPDNPRTVFYLANTLRDLGERAEALLYYLKRIEMGGWKEEVFVANLEAARIMREPSEFVATWLRRPWRAEPLADLARLYRSRGQTAKAEAVDRVRADIPVPEGDILFVELSAYGLTSSPWRVPHPQ